jgi:hypothetical protein
MTQDEVIVMAQECNLIGMRPFIDGIYTETLIAFAKLVEEKATEEANARANASWTLMCEKMVAFEREACAKVCDDKHDTWRWDNEPDSASGPRDCAAAIRARGDA